MDSVGVRVATGDGSPPQAASAIRAISIIKAAIANVREVLSSIAELSFL